MLLTDEWEHKKRADFCQLFLCQLIIDNMLYGETIFPAIAQAAAVAGEAR